MLGDGVTPAEASFRSGCACARDEDCRYNGCHCLADVRMGDSDDEESGGGGRVQVYAYQARGSRAGMLSSRMLQEDCNAVIYECHEECACSADCPNRVVERGRRVPLQIFRTQGRGWGMLTPPPLLFPLLLPSPFDLTTLRSLLPSKSTHIYIYIPNPGPPGVRSTVKITKGQFVDRYIGEIITSAEADRRRHASTLARKKDVYLFDLDKFHDPHSLDPRLRGPPLVVDGEFMSGPSRFINHSCDPNMRIYARVGDPADKHLHDLALFAARDVRAGEELTFDYTDGVVEEDGGDRTGMTRCRCGSENCRGWLF